MKEFLQVFEDGILKVHGVQMRRNV